MQVQVAVVFCVLGERGVVFVGVREGEGGGRVGMIMTGDVCMYTYVPRKLAYRSTHRCSHSWSSYCALLAANDAFWPAASRGAWGAEEEEEEEEERKGFSAPANGPWLSMQEVRRVGSCVLCVLVCWLVMGWWVGVEVACWLCRGAAATVSGLMWWWFGGA